MKLNEKAMLVRLTVSRWSARRIDRRATSEVCENHGCSQDVVKASKRLVRKGRLEKIDRICNDTRTKFYNMSLPWADSLRIIDKAIYSELMQYMLGQKALLQSHVKHDLIDRWSDIKAEAQQDQNGLFNEADWPELEDLPNKFGIDLEFMPMPTREDFRVSLHDAERDKIADDIERRTKERMAEAQKDLWVRVLEPVKHFAKVMNKENPRIYATTLTNIKDILEIAPKLNLYGDERIDNALKEIADSLGQYDLDILKKDDVVRSIAASEAEAAVASIESTMKGLFA